ncbi:MAG TPA: hypothetical protein VET85_07160 [Stellaceae bacterium]|nr:hypothetical protein [Stellaceae bacterium]
MRSGTFLKASAALMLAAWIAPAEAAETLTICLDENIPLYSLRDGEKGSGFAVSLSQSIANRLGSTLRIQWFEVKLDPEDSRSLAANALLSDGRCELVGTYPLNRTTLRKTEGPATARMPDYAGAKPADRRRRVELGTLVPSRAYLYAPLTIVLAPGVGKSVKGLADLDGLKLGIEASTMGDAILMLYKEGRFVDRIEHLRPGLNQLLPHLESGEFEATLVDLRRFDTYRAEHPDTKLVPTGYYYRIGVNMGYVGLASSTALVEKVSRIIEDMLAKNEIAPLASAVGLTYVAPRQPEISEELTLHDLRE